MHLRAFLSSFQLSQEGKCNQTASNCRRRNQTHRNALTALRPTDNWDDMVIYLIISKLNTITSREQQNSLTGTELPTFKQFIEFLNHRCQVLEATEKLSTLSASSSSRSQNNNKKFMSQSSCSYRHSYCRDFFNLSMSQRIAEARNINFV